MLPQAQTIHFRVKNTISSMSDSKQTQQLQWCSAELGWLYFRTTWVCCFLLKCHYILCSGELSFNMIWYMSSVARLALEVIGVSALMEHPSHCVLQYAALGKFKARAPLQSGSLTIYQLCIFLITFPTLQDVHYWISTTSFIHKRMIKTCCQ